MCENECLHYVGLLLLNGPVETASAKLDGPVDLLALPPVAGDGTVAANVHWIFFPLILPLTEFTFSCRAKETMSVQCINIKIIMSTHSHH